MNRLDEMNRRCEALRTSTWEINQAEIDFSIYGEDAFEPFTHRYWTNPDGETNVIYDKSGNVSHRVVHG